MTRLEANLEILRILTEYARNNPDERFGQILRNTEVVTEIINFEGRPTAWRNEFNTESTYTLAMVNLASKLRYIPS
jgi:hypothetical protein